MTTRGIDAVFLTTHNWGKSAKFFQALGFDLEFDTGHNSGQLRAPNGPFVFVAEVPADQEPALQIALGAVDPDNLTLDPVVEIVQPFEPTHWGTQEMIVRDPDGRNWTIQAPAAAAEAAGS